MFERIPRWRAVLGSALVLAGAGVVLSVPELVIGAIIPIGYITFSAVTSAQPVESDINVTRTITPKPAPPGREVEVTLQITNTGTRPIVDLRVTDCVPPELPVTDGTPKAAFGLRSGGSTTISYSVRARYGTYLFDGVSVQMRSMSGASLYSSTLDTAGDQKIETSIVATEWPREEQTIAFTGMQPSDSGGEGIEFHTTRQYRPGDPVNRIDWRRYAKEDELTTINYRKNESFEVLVLLDLRPPNNVAASDNSATGCELTVHAAAEAVHGIHAAKQGVGLAAIGVDDPSSGDHPYVISPSHGTDILSRLHHALEYIAERTTPTADYTLTAGSQQDIKSIRRALDSQTQVLVITPLMDEFPLSLVRELRVAGHSVNVFSPDITTTDSPGKTVARSDRALRLSQMRQKATTTVNWNPNIPLRAELERVMQ